MRIKLFQLSNMDFTKSPDLSATESLSIPVMKIPKLYSVPPLIIKPRLCPGSINNSTLNNFCYNNINTN